MKPALVAPFAEKFTLGARKRPNTPGEGTAGVNFSAFLRCVRACDLQRCCLPRRGQLRAAPTGLW
jgi:hypothetical protein